MYTTLLLKLLIICCMFFHVSMVTLTSVGYLKCCWSYGACAWAGISPCSCCECRLVRATFRLLITFDLFFFFPSVLLYSFTLASSGKLDMFIAFICWSQERVVKRGEELLKKVSNVSLEEQELIQRLYVLFNGMQCNCRTICYLLRLNLVVDIIISFFFEFPPPFCPRGSVCFHIPLYDDSNSVLTGLKWGILPTRLPSSC